jgi:hypothetical protein
LREKRILSFPVPSYVGGSAFRGRHPAIRQSYGNTESEERQALGVFLREIPEGQKKAGSA